MDEWPTRRKKTTVDNSKSSKQRDYNFFPIPRNYKRPKHEIINSLQDLPVASYNCMFMYNRLEKVDNTVNEHNPFTKACEQIPKFTPSSKHRVKHDSVFQRVSSFSNTRPIDLSMTKVYHENTIMDTNDVISSPNQVKEPSNEIKPSIYDKQSSLPSTVSTLRESFKTSPSISIETELTQSIPQQKEFSYQPNYVALNLKRHLNVKHSVHCKSKSVSPLFNEDETVNASMIQNQPTTQQQLENTVSGPGILEAEMVDLLNNAKQAQLVSLKARESKMGKSVPAKQVAIQSTSSTSSTKSIQPTQQISASSISSTQSTQPTQPTQSTQPTTSTSFQDDNNAPLCNHGIPAVLRKVKKAGKNHGREFYCCCYDYSHSCGFFLWKDNNRSDVIHLIEEMTKNEDHLNKNEDLFKLYWKDQLENRTIDEIKVLTKMVHCKQESTKKKCIQSLLDISTSLKTSLHEACECIQSDPNSLQTVVSSLSQSLFNIPSLHQEQLLTITSIVQAHDTLLIAPTGSGKSLTYQIPSLLHDGITLVISPLISLMHDQAKQLPLLLPSLILSDVISPQLLLQYMKYIQHDIIKVIFISPEKLFSSFFARLLDSTDLAKRIRLVVVDEAHCISSWSFNFRADYLRIYKVIERIRQKTSCSVLCLTATGGKEVKHDICTQLRIHSSHIIDSGWCRKELQCCSLHSSQPHLCQELLLKFLKSSYFSSNMNKKQNIIIFVPYRRDTQTLCEYLQSYNIDASAYHGGLDITLRKKSLRTFTHKENTLHVIVATSAFGLGVNLKSISCVIHLYAVRSIQAYIQEIGRYRGNTIGTLALSIITDSYMMQLYSACFMNYISKHVMDSFIQSLLCNKTQVNHAVLFSQTQQKYNISESIQRTLLILLENKGVINLTGDFYNHYSITPYSHDTLLKQNTLYASLIQYANAYDINQNVVEVDLMDYCEYVKQPLHEIRKQIRQLEVSHQIIIKPSELGSMYTLRHELTDEIKETIIQSMIMRQKNEVKELKRIYYLMCLLQGRKGEDMDVNNQDMIKAIDDHYKKEDAMQYKFECIENQNMILNKLLSVYFNNSDDFDIVIDNDDKRLMHIQENSVVNPIIKQMNENQIGNNICWPIKHIDSTVKPRIVQSAKMLLKDDRISKQHYVGITFAKIWHGLSTPVYPSDIWSLSQQWKLFIQYDFIELCNIADEVIKDYYK